MRIHCSCENNAIGIKLSQRNFMKTIPVAVRQIKACEYIYWRLKRGLVVPKDNLTSEEKSAQLRFKAAWDSWQAEDKKGRTQQLIADQLGINQPSLGQYINGRNPLNHQSLDNSGYRIE